MDGQAGGALARWRDQLEGWVIPPEILAAAPESPWGFPVGLFRSRAHRAESGPPTPSNTEAARHLPAGGSVLDVGAGGGAASLPLAGTAGRLVGVDALPEMVAAFLAAARAAGVDAEGVEGGWQEVAGRVGPADVVVCHHVLYNVADLAPFALALTGHARRRVVAELTDRHPLAGLRPLWRRGRRRRRRPGGGPPGLGAAGPVRLRRLRRAGGVHPPAPVPPGGTRPRGRRGPAGRGHPAGRRRLGERPAAPGDHPVVAGNGHLTRERSMPWTERPGCGSGVRRPRSGTTPSTPSPTTSSTGRSAPPTAASSPTCWSAARPAG